MTELTAWNSSTGHAYYDRLWLALLHAPVLLHALALMPGLKLANH